MFIDGANSEYPIMARNKTGAGGCKWKLGAENLKYVYLPTWDLAHIPVSGAASVLLQLGVLLLLPLRLPAPPHLPSNLQIAVMALLWMRDSLQKRQRHFR